MVKTIRTLKTLLTSTIQTDHGQQMALEDHIPLTIRIIYPILLLRKEIQHSKSISV